MSNSFGRLLLISYETHMIGNTGSAFYTPLFDAHLYILTLYFVYSNHH